MLSQLFDGFILKFDLSGVSLLTVQKGVFLCCLRYVCHSTCREIVKPEIQVTFHIMLLSSLLSENHRMMEWFGLERALQIILF